MYILGIETSCDETAASVVQYIRDKMHVLSNSIASQAALHTPYGGVVPEIAARNHVPHIIPIIHNALTNAGVRPTQLTAIAVTKGPGLLTSLSVGVETAKTLAILWKKPLLGVNHMEAHIFSAILEKFSNVPLPAIALTVSGGHTELVLIKKLGTYKIIGRTRDDAAGEAFDKCAKMIGLPYPGGPSIAKAAELGDPNTFDFPRPMMHSRDLSFSFSGLKTAVLYTVQKIKKLTAQTRANLAASIEQAIVDVLVYKTIQSIAPNAHNILKPYQTRLEVRSVILAGGVAANKKLRLELRRQLANTCPNIPLFTPAQGEYTDNAAMIAKVGAFYAAQKKFTPIHKLLTDANLSLPIE